MRKLIFIFLLFALKTNGQVYQLMSQYGYDAKRMNFDSTLQIPTVCGVPTLKSVVGTKKAAIAFDSCNKRFYYYNPKLLAWDTIKGGSGSSIDTTSLSNRIDSKVSISDTVNKWIGNIVKTNDSTIAVVKDGTITNISITGVDYSNRLKTLVYNKSGATITKGSVVYIDGAHSSNLPSIALAKANAEPTSAYTYGLVESDIADNSSGIVIQNGKITNLNLPTSTYTDGQTLYLSPTTAGGYTTTKPTAPNHYVAIGTITRAHPVFGTIQVAIRNGFQLDEMSDVSIAAVPIDSTILQFSRVDSLWHDVNPTTAMGNLFVKRTDSAAMLLPYLRKADTATLSNRINLKVNISDTASMLSPYTRTSTLTSYLQKSDSTTYQTKYRSDTARTNIYSGISSKVNLSDTSAFQRKSLTSYSFIANNTNATANGTAQVFKDVAQQTYTGTITWTGTTAPSGTTNHTYQWSQIGKLVTIRISLDYSVAGAGLSQVTMTLPSDCPTPLVPTNVGASAIINYGVGMLNPTNTMASFGTISAGSAGLRVNSTNTGYEITVVRVTASTWRFAYAMIQYFAQ